MFIINPEMTKFKNVKYDMGGYIGYLTGNVINEWLLEAPFSNPGMLEIFNDRNRKPLRDMIPWAGEFAGKHLTSAVQVYALTRDEKLGCFINWFVDRLFSLQDSDGYIGCWPDEYKLSGNAPNAVCIKTWDAWAHYHIILGLILWYRETGYEKALDCAEKIGDLLCSMFLNTDKKLVDTGNEEMNLAPIHGLCLLYEETGDEKYLEMAFQIEREFEVPHAGDYVRTALSGVEFYMTPKPRWESLHSIQGIAELYFITGNEKYLKAFENIWWSICKGDRHNTGGFSSGEKACGDPYNKDPVETCCTIAWMALTLDYLRMTGNPLVADELELSLYNSGIGAISPSGRWCTYDTPMDGVRKASAHSIVGHSREGTPELNCCAVNGARSLGILSEWAVMRHEEGIVINYYGPYTCTIKLDSNNNLKLIQETDYPITGNIKIKIGMEKSEKIGIQLRIPDWSNETGIAVNGEHMIDIKKGSYLSIERVWNNGDLIEIKLDNSLHFAAGENACEGKCSIYRGPVLLAYDRKFNDFDPDSIPELDAAELSKPGAGVFIDGMAFDNSKQKYELSMKNFLKPWMLFKYKSISGKDFFLCDFATAGDGGNNYITWLPVKNIKKIAFTRDNPLRSAKYITS